jgi:antitoxin YefM
VAHQLPFSQVRQQLRSTAVTPELLFVPVARPTHWKDSVTAELVALTGRPFLVILLTMTVLPLGEVKSHLSELVGRVHDHHERVTVTVHGRPSAVLVAIEDLERLEETLAILRDADTVGRLTSSDAELARGESVSAEELAEVMRQRSAKQ